MAWLERHSGISSLNQAAKANLYVRLILAKDCRAKPVDVMCPSMTANLTIQEHITGISDSKELQDGYAAVFLNPFQALLSIRFIIALICAPGPSSCSCVLPVLRSTFRMLSH